MAQMPERNFGFLLTGVTRLFLRLFERESQELGLTLAQCRVLAFIARNEGVSQARVAGGTDFDQMALVRILDRMEADRWIERRSNPGDRRAYRLYLREAAKPLLERIWQVSGSARDMALAKLPAIDCKRLLDALEHVHGRLTALDLAAANPGAVDETVAIKKPKRRASTRT